MFFKNFHKGAWFHGFFYQFGVVETKAVRSAVWAMLTGAVVMVKMAYTFFPFTVATVNYHDLPS